MKKERYERAELDVIEFKVEDMILASDEPFGDPDNDEVPIH